jgi:hypothetical protein
MKKVNKNKAFLRNYFIGFPWRVSWLVGAADNLPWER